MTTKILALTDALGNLVRFVLLPGQRFDTVGVPPLIKGLAFDALIADKAFDSNTIIADLDARGAKVVVSRALRFRDKRCIQAGTYTHRTMTRKSSVEYNAIAWVSEIQLCVRLLSSMARPLSS
jgi:transposase